MVKPEDNMALTVHSLIQLYALKVILLWPKKNLETDPAQGEDRDGETGEDSFLAWSQSILTHFLAAPTNWISALHIEKKTHKQLKN